MDKISSFQLEGTEVNVLYKKGHIGYNFLFDGQYYGQQIELKGKSTIEVVTATFLLLVNVLETKKALVAAKADGQLLNNNNENGSNTGKSDN